LFSQETFTKTPFRRNQLSVVGADMKKTALALTLILALLPTIMAGTVVNLGKADPIINFDWVPPDTDTDPPLISILFPENKLMHNANNVSVNLNVTIGESKTASYVRIMDIYYEADWQKNNISLYHNAGKYIPTDPHPVTEFSSTLNLTEIPEGKHYIAVYVVEWGAYIEEPVAHMFSINSSSSVNFTIDIGSPSLSVFSPANKTYNISDVPLNFTVSEPCSQISYILDGLENVTVNGNTTLAGLTNGNHNATVYATDEAGNIGVPNTVHFTVDAPEPLSTIIAVTTSGVTIAVVITSLFVYFKKHRHVNNDRQTKQNLISSFLNNFLI